MELADLVENDGLQQDDYSELGEKFGSDRQLSIIGWSGKNGSQKYYIVKCSICSKDKEMFGEGYFRISKSDLHLGVIPCGCSKQPVRTKEQYAVMCSRKANSLGYKFLGFVGEWKGQTTKIKMLCKEHGEWSSGNIHNLINKGTGCPKCKVDKRAEMSKKPDHEIINSFLASGAFHPDTKFWRSERKCGRGTKCYWHYECLDCLGIGEGTNSNLKLGQYSCDCSKHRQKECYINWIVDENDTTIAIKFGIATNSISRTKVQNTKSTYSVRQYLVYKLPSVSSCRKAERECKQELECGIVLKRDLKDGYTETTWIYNKEKIIEIYEKNRCIKVE